MFQKSRFQPLKFTAEIHPENLFHVKYQGYSGKMQEGKTSLSLLFIDRVALAKQGDNALGSVCLSVSAPSQLNS